MEDRIKITILSDINYDSLLAEILIDDEFIGLVTNEPDKPVCFEVPAGELKFQSLDLSLFQVALSRAKIALLNIKRPLREP